MPHPEICIFFFFIAFVYASVGFGGGSSYLAVLALYALPFKQMRLIALLCNIVVVAGGSIIFLRHGQVNLRKIAPLAVMSVPMAFIGAIVKISEQTFFIVLGMALIAAAVLLWINTSAKMKHEEVSHDHSYFKNGFLGGAIGFLSGMVGIGGGIFLSPLLNLMRWDTPKKIAATASVFILVNSFAGIAGQFYQLPATINYVQIILLAVSVFAGGQLGSRFGAAMFNQLVVRRITAIVVLIAGIEVLSKHLS